MNTNLSMFLLNKSEMNSISGGAIWRCSYNDHIEILQVQSLEKSIFWMPHQIGMKKEWLITFMLNLAIPLKSSVGQ